MLPLIAKYRALQETDQALRGVAAQLAQLPARRAALAERLTAARLPLQQQEAAVKAAEKQARGVDQIRTTNP